MKRPKLKPAEAAKIRDEWLSAGDALRKQVRDWAEQQGWSVTESEGEVTEYDLGTYTVPVLEIETPRGEVVLRPVGQDILGGWGRVDLSAWPTLYRVMLIRKPGLDWAVRTDQGSTGHIHGAPGRLWSSRRGCWGPSELSPRSATGEGG